jgi:hypothetical protein
MFTVYARRAVLGFSLFIGQAFLCNAITFGYAQILATFFGIKTNPGYYSAVIAAGNLLGPLAPGRLSDALGRKPVIADTYLLSGAGVLGRRRPDDRGRGGRDLPRCPGRAAGTRANRPAAERGRRPRLE